MFKYPENVIAFQIVALVFAVSMLVMSIFSLAVIDLPLSTSISIGFGGLGWLVAAYLPSTLLRKSREPGNGEASNPVQSVEQVI